MKQITRGVRTIKNTRTLRKIGARRYGFDFDEEKLIYDYLCCRRIKRKDIKKIKYKFNTCLEWEKYVEEKYDRLSYDDLYCFRKLLCQHIEGCYMDYDMYRWIYPIILSVYFTKIFDYIQFFHFDLNEEVVAVSLILVVLAWSALLFAVMIVIYSVVKLLWMGKEKVKFCEDYSEIICGMLKRKKHE